MILHLHLGKHLSEARCTFCQALASQKVAVSRVTQPFAKIRHSLFRELHDIKCILNDGKPFVSVECDEGTNQNLCNHSYQNRK